MPSSGVYGCHLMTGVMDQVHGWLYHLILFFVMEYNVPGHHLKVQQYHIHTYYMYHYDSHVLQTLPQQYFRPAVLAILDKYR